MKPRVLSPLRYPGGKARLAPYIRQCLQRNRVAPALFVEPFAGGASVSLQLLVDGVVECIGLVELDPLVAAFWQTLFYDSEWLVDQVQAIDISLDTWSRFRTGVMKSRRDRALACLFLNRTSFSGVLAPTAGPIGGYHQQGRYRIDARFPRDTLIHRIRFLAGYRNRVSFIWKDSWESALTRISSLQEEGKLPTNIAYYFDPPFFHQANRLYSYYFSDRDHVQLRDALVKLEAPWLLSYDAPHRIRELYGSGTRRSHVEALYSAARGNHAVPEVVVTNLPYLPNELCVREMHRVASPLTTTQGTDAIFPLSPKALPDHKFEVAEELTA